MCPFNYLSIFQVNRDEDFTLVCVPIFRGNHTSTKFQDMHIEAKRVSYIHCKKYDPSKFREKGVTTQRINQY